MQNLGLICHNEKLTEKFELLKTALKPVRLTLLLVLLLSETRSVCILR